MDSICQRIEEQRQRGRTVCAFFAGADVIPRADRLTKLGYRDIPEQLWVAASREEAKAVLIGCLSRDLAYSEEMMPEEQAADLAAGFLQNFDDKAQFLTNSRRFFADSSKAESWEPISSATFDTGVLVQSNGVVGILWVEDED